MRDRLLLTGIGSGGGLLAGVSYWFAWGCRACAKGKSPWEVIAFMTIMGAILANAWGMDHLRNRRRGA